MSSINKRSASASLEKEINKRRLFHRSCIVIVSKLSLVNAWRRINSLKVFIWLWWSKWLTNCDSSFGPCARSVAWMLRNKAARTYTGRLQELNQAQPKEWTIWFGGQSDGHKVTLALGPVYSVALGCMIHLQGGENMSKLDSKKLVRHHKNIVSLALVVKVTDIERLMPWALCKRCQRNLHGLASRRMKKPARTKSSIMKWSFGFGGQDERHKMTFALGHVQGLSERFCTWLC